MESNVIDTIIAIVVVVAWNGYLIYRWVRDDQ